MIRTGPPSSRAITAGPEGGWNGMPLRLSQAWRPASIACLLVDITCCPVDIIC